jgi:hypothetical protein
MREVFAATLRARGLRGSAITFTLMLFALGAMMVTLVRGGFGLPIICALYALMVTNGLIGEDVRDGSVALLLARPVTRTRYLGGRLAAAAVLSGAFSLVLVGAVSVAVRPPLEGLVSMAVSALTTGLWAVAVIFFFSTFLPGRADAVCALSLWLSVGALYMARTQMDRPRLEQSLEWLWDNVTSTVVVVGLEPTPAVITDALRWGSNLLLVVLAGAVIFNRRQFGYAD